MTGCACPQGPGRHITDPERHAEWHRQVVEQGGPDGIVNAATLRATRGIVGTVASATIIDTRAIESGKRVPGWLRRAASAISYDAWLPIFIESVRGLEIGTEFTTAYLHNKIPDPPHPNHWGKAQSHVRKLGLARPVDVQASELETTKSSLVRRWVRVDNTAAATRGAA
jgi:hypothetical protein